jgi:adenine/guanine phosphoribosyltransferase-like PRPP-binding protein
VLASIVAAAAAAAVVIVVAVADAGFVIAATLSSPLSPSPLPSLSPLPSRR